MGKCNQPNMFINTRPRPHLYSERQLQSRKICFQNLSTPVRKRTFVQLKGFCNCDATKAIFEPQLIIVWAHLNHLLLRLLRRRCPLLFGSLHTSIPTLHTITDLLLFSNSCLHVQQFHSSHIVRLIESIHHNIIQSASNPFTFCTPTVCTISL